MQSSSLERSDDPILTGLAAAAALATGLAAFLALILALARSGLESPPWLLPACLTIFAAAAFAPCALPDRWRVRWAETPWMFPLVSLGVLVSPLLVFVFGRAVGVVYPVLAVVGLIRALPWLARVRLSTWALLLLGPCVMAVHLFIELGTERYAHVYTPEYAQIGILELDTLFHTSMASMLQHFGVGSTGLDGLVAFKYHHGSHLWLAALGQLSGTEPLYAYPYGQMIVAVPALFLGLLFATTLLSDRRDVLGARFALVIALVLIFDRVGWSSYYISESYTFGLAALGLGAPLLVDFARRPVLDSSDENRRQLAMIAVIFVAAGLKVSVGTVLGASFGWLVLRGHGFSWRTLTAVIGLLGVAAFIWLRLKPETGLPLQDSFALFHFYRSPSILNLNPYRGWASPLLPLAAAGWLAWRARREAGEDKRRSSARMAELLLVAQFVALLPSVLLVMWSATAWWFANVPHWLALPLVAGQLGFGTLSARRRQWVAAALVAFVFLWVGVSLTDLRAHRTWQLAVVLQTRAQMLLDGSPPRMDVAQSALKESWRQARRLFAPSVREGLAKAPGAQLVAEVERLRPPDGREFAIFVPPSNQDLWSLGRFPCLTAPLNVPALTGAPLVKGVGQRCPVSRAMSTYGYYSYHADSRTGVLSREELCQHALARGFARIVLIERLEPWSGNRLIDCAP